MLLKSLLAKLKEILPTLYGWSNVAKFNEIILCVQRNNHFDSINYLYVERNNYFDLTSYLYIQRHNYFDSTNYLYVQRNNYLDSPNYLYIERFIHIFNERIIFILLHFIYELDKWDKRDLEKSLQSKPPKRKHQKKARESYWRSNLDISFFTTSFYSF